jgi:hypothetical protein
MGDLAGPGFREASAPDAFIVPAVESAFDPEKPGPESAAVFLPSAPELGGSGYAALAANPQREGVPWAAVWHQPPFSRIGIGADLSPLGIGIKVTTPLDDYLDLRALFGFFNFNTGRMEVDGFNINGNIHFASVGAVVDVYPWNSVWRVSGGLMLFNGNRISASTEIVPGTSFTIDGKTYYSSSADPVTGSGEVDLHNLKVEPMVSFGFGRYVPHSNRHWSFPTEFGIIYTGSPTLTVNTAGTVCTSLAQTSCSDIGDTSNPVGQAFNSNLNAQLAKWRADLDKVEIYPIFSYGVVYSFNIR